MNQDYPAKPFRPTLAAPRLAVRVLLIEDDHSYAELVKILLSANPEQECQVTVASSLQQGLQQLAGSQDFDAVLLDLSLPDSAGLDTLRGLLSAFPNTNVIVLTGSSDREQGTRAVGLGAQDYLVKGEFEPNQLARALRFSMERKQILTRLEEAQQIAHIGNWEFRPFQNYFIASKEVYLILGLDPQRPIFSYTEIQSLACPFHILLAQEDLPAEEEALSRSLQWESDGRMCYAQLNSRRFKTPDGDFFFVGTLQDTTLQKRAEELQRAQELAKKTARVREQVIANVSHELRTPMNAIVGMSNLLIGTPLNEEQKEYVDAVQEASQLLLGIINDILLTSSLQNGELELNPAPFDLPMTVRRVTEALKPRAIAKGISLSYELSDAIPQRLIGDKQRLSQVLYNIVGNAVKFTESGKVQLVVTEQASADPGEARIGFSVHDTGPGISEDKQEEIFQAFSRIITPGKKTEGTGLGLSIAKQLVEQLGGHIQLLSKPGVGSEFSFTLPFAYGAGTAQQPDHKAPVISNKDNLKLGRILIVEDHFMNQVVLRKTLEQQWPGIEIIVVNDGEQAIVRLEAENFDLVFMDIQLPGIDGFMTTQHVRQFLADRHAHTPVLAMTAQAQIAEDERYQQAGLNDYILKPFDPQELFDKITHYLKTQ
jgi:signal transduction histidine kinase/BarA-like signal transduction histidine kinase